MPGRGSRPKFLDEGFALLEARFGILDFALGAGRIDHCAPLQPEAH